MIADLTHLRGRDYPGLFHFTLTPTTTTLVAADTFTPFATAAVATLTPCPRPC